MLEALAALQEHRKQRREWEAAQADEIEAALDLKRLEAHVRERQQRHLSPAEPGQAQSARRDRRAAVLRAWHQGGWIEAETIPAIMSARYDEKRGYPSEFTKRTFVANDRKCLRGWALSIRPKIGSGMRASRPTRNAVIPRCTTIAAMHCGFCLCDGRAKVGSAVQSTTRR